VERQSSLRRYVLNAVARLLLTSTALAPVGLTYAWVAYIEGEPKVAGIIACVSIVLVVLCLVVLNRAQVSLAASSFRAQSIEAADHENTAFLLLYVMPLLTSQFKALDWHFWLPTVLIFGLITAFGYNYHFNPLLVLLGWHFYRVESTEGVTFVLITKKQLRTAATDIKVGQLTEYILLDLGGA
jgi:hypothetical protein